MISRRRVVTGMALPVLSLAPSECLKARRTGEAVDFGLIGDDGTRDQTAAFRRLAKAISDGSVRGRVALPVGTIRITGNILISGGNASLIGSYGATIIRCDKNARLAIEYEALDETNSPSIEIEGISFRCSGIHTSAMLSVSCGPNSLGSTAQPVILRNLEFQGVTEFDGFTVGFSLNNVPNPIVTNVRFFGDRGNFNRGGVRSGTALQLTSDRAGAGGSGKFVRINAYWMHMVVDVSGHQEGHVFSEMAMICVRHGIAWTAPFGGNPLFVLRDSFLNCTTRCVYAANMVQCDVSGNTFYSEGIPGETNVPIWEGVKFDNVEPHDMMSSLTDNMFLMTVGPALRRIGVQIDASPTGGRTSVLVRNRYQGDPTKDTAGIVLGPGTTGVQVSADNMFSGVRQPIVDAGKGNVINYRS